MSELDAGPTPPDAEAEAGTAVAASPTGDERAPGPSSGESAEGATAAAVASRPVESVVVADRPADSLEAPEPDAPASADVASATGEPSSTDERAADSLETAAPEGAEGSGPSAAVPEGSAPSGVSAVEAAGATPAAVGADAAPVAAVGADAAPAAAVEAAQPAAAPEPPRTVGRLIADALRAAGVRYAFTVPGESFLGVLDALGDAGIRVVATRHEGAAAFMAEAYGQLTGRPAACLGTRAVGAGNLAIGIHTARQDSTPMFALVGQVERSKRGREAFQEVDQLATYGGLAKWAAEPRTAADVAGVVGEAVRRALSGRPGPVLLSLPEDLLDEPAPTGASVDVSRSGPVRPTDDEIRAVLQLLASAERPVILAGAGVLRARTSSDLTRFAELLHVPVIASWRRGDVMSNDHHLYLGMAGLGSPSVVRERLERADAILVLGSRLGEPTSFGYRIPAAGQRWAHVDLDPVPASGPSAPVISVATDARAFLRASNERLVNRGVLHAGLVDSRRRNNEADRAAWETATVVDAEPWEGPGVHPGRTIATLRRVLPDEAILTTDAGNFAGWARGFRFRRPGTFIGPTSGAMGYGLPAAIAAALVHRDRPVVALTGDGGLAMTMAELETAVRERTRVVVLVFDNERYGTIRMWQERRGTGIGVATELGPIDFAAIARACGARGIRVETDAEFEPALRQALVADRPTVIHLALDPRWVSVDQSPA
jgi:acetolactate synthase-1/2/3 large subunit